MESNAKQVLHQIQEMEKKRLESEPDVIEDPLMKDYIQYLKNKTEQCKAYLNELSKSRLTPNELKKNIEDFIRTL